MRKAFSTQNHTTKLGIALQGGGSYGAYTKGVLKALFNSKSFNSPQLQIKAVTGTSAGAVNGALITYGLNSGDSKEAVKLLDSFWQEIVDIGRKNKALSMFNPLSAPYPNLPPNAAAMMRLLPKGYVPAKLKKMIDHYIPDWKILRNGPVKLFVNAVKENPETGKRRHIVFKGKTLRPDAIAASGALEEFGGYVINGQKFYDGAYWRNPCMSDIKKENITDLLIITLQKKPDAPVQPIHQDDFRKNHMQPGHELITEEIHHHIAHIHKHHPHLNLHVISLQTEPHWDETSRMNTDPQWLAELEQMGYEDGKKWLIKNARHLGKKSTYEQSAPIQSCPKQNPSP